MDLRNACFDDVDIRSANLKDTGAVVDMRTAPYVSDDTNLCVCYILNSNSYDGLLTEELLCGLKTEICEQFEKHR